MNMKVTNEVIYWRGPSPFHFVEISDRQSKEIKMIAQSITYGWGVLPASIKIGKKEWTTALFPKNGRYLIPLKDAIRKSEGIELGDRVTIDLTL
jgi:hypothetical protein